jgi:hypothetical protein
MMRGSIVVAVVFGFAAIVHADDQKKTPVELAGLSGTAPADWKVEKPSSSFRQNQFRLEKEKGDAEDGDLAVFVSQGGGGVEANLKRQEAKFKLADGVKKEDAIKVSETKVGNNKATYQDIRGTFLARERPGDPSSKVTEKEKYRQLYVIFEANGTTYSVILVGPEKTVEKHKKGFDEFIGSFKK